MTHLETDRLIFRDHEISDLEPFCEMESDVAYRWPQPVHSRQELERSFRESWLPKKRLGFLAAVYKAEGRYIGRCGLYPFRTSSGDADPMAANLGYYLARPYSGRGLATEAARAFVAYGFKVLGLERIEAGMSSTNHASVRVAENAGLFRVATGGSPGAEWYRYEARRSDWLSRT